MTSTTENPLGWRLDEALELIGKRFSRLAGMVQGDATSRIQVPAADPNTDDSVIEEEPVNPLRHWRWE